MALPYGSSSEFKLDNPPLDCIQKVRFDPTDSSKLITANWDTSVKLYDILTNQICSQYNHDAPVLDATFQSSGKCWSVGCDSNVKTFDIETREESTVGTHDMPIKCVEFLPELNLIATASWDKTLKLWDPRTVDENKQSCISTVQLPDKAYAMAVCGDNLLIGTAGRRVVIYDLKTKTSTLRESLLKYQTRCIEAFPNKKGYVVSSIEGRVGIEYMDMSPEVQKKKYAFKCHRSKDPTTGQDIIYPVNTISFHQRFSTFATGGSDGFVSIWDGQNKKRLVQFHKYPTSISSLSFSHDGTLLAIACSPLDVYDTDKESLKDNATAHSIFIRKVHEFEAKSKTAEQTD